MKYKLRAALLLIASVSTAWFARANTFSTTDDDDGPPGEPPPELPIDPAFAGYLEHVAEHGADEPVVDAELPPECEDGEVLWHRDGLTDLCAPLCATDDDCIVGLERCAALVIPGVVEPIPVDELYVDDNGEPIPAEARAFVDDDAVAVERVEAGQAIAVCDPFFDLDGATDDADFLADR